ncbi:MAG: 4Fe-4S binding protein [Methanoculleus sp.]|nr:4Fe-4S binding protein [Methanoculleus sp.]
MALFPKYSKTREGQNVIMEQRLLKAVNNLILNAETCTGCGICVDACPEEAIVLGPVGATRRGAIDYAEPVDVNAEKCSYCGVCVIMCPFNAMTLKIDGEERLPILEKEGFPTYDMVTVIDEEKCDRCTICEEVCPRDAIARDVPAFEGGDETGKPRQAALQTKTTFTVDTEKCDVCGICGELCPSITVIRNAADPETGKIEGEVKWEETTCDGCTICVEACPKEAITLEREVISNKLPGKVDIQQDNCCTCTWCVQTCPQEAITVEKLFEGELEIHPEKCPGGCSTCIEVCPCNALYLPSPLPAKEMKGEVEANIALNKDFCILCGACVNACPSEDALVLRRTGIRMQDKDSDLFKRIKEKLLAPRTSRVKETAPGEVEVKVLEEA